MDTSRRLRVQGPLGRRQRHRIRPGRSRLAGRDPRRHRRLRRRHRLQRCARSGDHRGRARHAAIDGLVRLRGLSAASPTQPAERGRIVIAWHEALNDSDIDRLRRLCSEDVEVGDAGETRRGLAALRQQFGRQACAWNSSRSSNGVTSSWRPKRSSGCRRREPTFSDLGAVRLSHRERPHRQPDLVRQSRSRHGGATCRQRLSPRRLAT